ncbi:MAG: response regulator [Vulcanimicrobiota bacterium]
MTAKTRILVLEDDRDFLQVLVENLEEEDFPVWGAASNAEALAVAQQQTLDLVITDVRMAGKDGIDTLAELRALQPMLRSIVITGFASEEAPGRAIRQQASDYLYKPFRLVELLKSIERTMQHEQQRSRAQDLLAPVVEGYRKLVAALATLVSNRQLAAVEKIREHAYNGFYVSVRSQALDDEQALRVWDALEELERDRQQLKEGRLDLALCQRLVEGYQWTLDLMVAYARQPLAAARPTGPGQVSRRQFKHFYQQIQQGWVPIGHMSLAPFLRSLNRLTLSQSQQLAALYQQCWGQPEEA